MADNWKEVSGNLPSDFGFVIYVHTHELCKLSTLLSIKKRLEHYVHEGKLGV